MPTIEINLIKLPSQRTPIATDKTRAPGAPRALFVFAGIFGFLLVGTTAFSYAQSRTINSPLSKTFNTFVSMPLTHLGIAKDQRLVGEERDRINILLLGIGGKNHDGAYLSDTIILASIQPSTRKLALISIPRDLLVNIDTYGWRKINNADAFGEMARPGGGPELSSAVISKTLDIPIDYHVRMDFAGFSKIIDTIGGVSLTVDRTFTDYRYPTENYKYQAITFREGPTTMDGETALKFARSRHSGMNNEGSDFARSKRQQKVMVAVKEKILSQDVLFNPSKLAGILTDLQDNIVTNIKLWEMVRLGMLMKDTNVSQAAHIVFDDGPTNFLVSDNIDGAYVLRPKDGTFEGMQKKVATVFSEQEESSISLTQIARVVIRNGTKQEGLALRTAQTLKEQGLIIVSYGNAAQTGNQNTIIYDYTNGTKLETVTLLTQSFPRAVIMKTALPEELRDMRPDFLIVLGADAS